MEKSTFKNLSIGDSFDFINDLTPGYNSFFKRCTKISARKYKDETGTVYQVGSTKTAVYHIQKVAL